MAHFTVSLALICLISLTNGIDYQFRRDIRRGPLCPVEWDLGACRCEPPPGVPTIECSAVSSVDELVKVFNIGPGKMNLRAVEIHGSKSLTDIPDNAFGEHTIHLFLLDDNHIRSVGKNAFSGSEETASVIDVSRNEISDFPFESLASFKSMQFLRLAHNKITEIRENSVSNANVQMIDLSDNAIESVGKNAFFHVQNLQKLDLSGNKLTTINDQIISNDQSTNSIALSLANNSISQIGDGVFDSARLATLDLSNNNLNVLKENVFASLLKADNPLQTLVIDGNPIDCGSKEMQWIIPQEAVAKIPGFKCKVEQP